MPSLLMTVRSRRLNDALRRGQAEHAERLQALRQFVRDYEAEHGVITDQEMREARRYFASRTTKVRSKGSDHRKAPSRI